MHSLRPASSPLPRLQVKATPKPGNFLCLAPQAKGVFLVGDFNDWDPATRPMKMSLEGSQQLAGTLGHGGHHYQFIVDGKPVNEPRAQRLARDERGGKVSMIQVSWVGSPRFARTRP
jgi:1,4-alpha-glucan branching enzyme